MKTPRIPKAGILNKHIVDQNVILILMSTDS